MRSGYFDKKIRSERIKAKIKLINRRQKIYEYRYVLDWKNGYRILTDRKEKPHYLSKRDLHPNFYH